MTSAEAASAPMVVIKFSDSPVSEEQDMSATDFFDYMLAMHAMPDQVELRTADSGWPGLVRDARNIRGYFQNAASKLFPE